MITVFSIPKAFERHINVIQRNAIESWTRCGFEVVLFGDDSGTREVASEFGARHVPDVATNDFGTPLLDDAFSRAQDMSSHDVLVYANCDIVLLPDLLTAGLRLANWRSTFLGISRRWDIEIDRPIDFSPGWPGRVGESVRTSGTLHGMYWIDVFVFRRHTLAALPPFAVGRPKWDNWMVFNARVRRVPVVDLTPSVTIVHQNHDYFTGRKASHDHVKGPEVAANRSIAGEIGGDFNMTDATHVLVSGAKAPRPAWFRLESRIERIPALRPRAAWALPIARRGVRTAMAARRAMTRRVR